MPQLLEELAKLSSLFVRPLPRLSGLRETQIRAIHTSDFLSAFARLITSGREAVTPAGSNLFPRESCLPCVCVYPHRCGSWKPRLSSWLLVPAVVSQARHHSLFSPPQGAAFWGGRVAEQKPRPSQVPLWPCQGGMCCASLAVAIMAITPISSLLLPVSMWGKTAACKEKDRLGEQTKRSMRIAQFNSRPWHFSAASQKAECSLHSPGWVAGNMPAPGVWPVHNVLLQECAA